jgi:hypothetical protein
MKRFNFLLAAIALVLTVAAVGCTTMAGTQDDYYDGQQVYGNRVYVDDPYRGTIVLERDPWTGRYYQVGGYSPYYSYGNRYYSRGNRNNSYGNTYRRNNSGSYNRNSSNNNQNNNRLSDEYKKEKSDARNKILGKH